MKKIFYLILILFLNFVILAQEKTDETKDKDKSNVQQKTDILPKTNVQENNQSLEKEIKPEKNNKPPEDMKPDIGKEKFVDLDGDGINDVRSPKPNMPPNEQKKKVEHFTDKDGDGINDDRARGMGWSSKDKKRGFGKH
jgi:hypothetical protein